MSAHAFQRPPIIDALVCLLKYQRQLHRELVKDVDINRREHRQLPMGSFEEPRATLDGIGAVLELAGACRICKTEDSLYHVQSQIFAAVDDLLVLVDENKEGSVIPEDFLAARKFVIEWASESEISTAGR